MYRAILRACRSARLKSGSQALAAITLGARTFGEIVEDTGLSRTAAAQALHALQDLGLVEHDKNIYQLRPQGFDAFDEDDPSPNFGPPCNVVALTPLGTNFRLPIEEQQQPDPVHISDLPPELATIAGQIRRWCPDFNPRPYDSLEHWITHWADRADRMRQHLAAFADTQILDQVTNRSAWLRSGVETNWAPATRQPKKGRR